MIVLYLYLTMVLKVKCNLLQSHCRLSHSHCDYFKHSDNPVAKQSNIVLTYGQTDENEMRMEPQLRYLHKCLLLIYCTIDILR